MQRILITNHHPAGFAFALTEANEQVFIPPYAADGAQLERGQHYQAVLIPNHKEQERGRTPFMAVSVIATEHTVKSDDQPATPAIPATSANQDERDEAVYKLICGNTYVTTAAKADVYNRAGQLRPSFVLWAENANEFVE